jgi:hypothetical protein
MGWSDKSHYMRSIYTRGSELQFAAEVNLPSMVSIWHAGQTPTVPSFAHGPPERRDGPAAHQQQRRAKGWAQPRRIAGVLERTGRATGRD